MKVIGKIPGGTYLGWGDIDGDIYKQQDLIDLLNKLGNRYINLINNEAAKRQAADDDLASQIAEEKSVREHTDEYILNIIRKGIHWGEIKGNIRDQKDLADELDSKNPDVHLSIRKVVGNYYNNYGYYDSEGKYQAFKFEHVNRILGRLTNTEYYKEGYDDYLMCVTWKDKD